MLRQNSKGQAEIIREIRRFRERNAPDPSATLAAARAAAPRQYARLLEVIEWKLIEMPLPRLQVMGGVHDPFIYRIEWDVGVKQAQTRAPEFDARVRFVGRAAEYLVQLVGLLRPLVEAKWANRILRFNRQMVSDAGLPEFLFGAERVPLSPSVRSFGSCSPAAASTAAASCAARPTSTTSCRGRAGQTTASRTSS